MKTKKVWNTPIVIDLLKVEQTAGGGPGNGEASSGKCEASGSVIPQCTST